MHRSLRGALLAGCVGIALGSASPLHAAGVTASAWATPAVLQQDAGSTLYREGRRALNRGNYREAAELFARIRREHEGSARAGDSYYYEAVALTRMGGNRNLSRALELLETQANEFPEASTREDAPALRVRIQADLATMGVGEAVVELVRDADQECDESKQEVRAMALSALINMDSGRAMPILQGVLRNRDECSAELRRQAVFLVSQHAGPETVDILLDLAHNDPDPDKEVREQAVFWLSQVHTEEALDALESILRESNDQGLQENAIYAISQHRSERSTAILKEFAEREGAPVDLRQNAIFWIGQTSGGGDYLRELFDRIENDDLKENIVYGIARSGSEADGAWLMEKALDEGEAIDVRKNALFWAGKSGIKVARLGELYETVREKEMKEQVIFLLSQHQNEREAVDQLVRIIENEPDTDLKRNAIFWLGKSDDPRVPDILLRIIG